MENLGQPSSGQQTPYNENTMADDQPWMPQIEPLYSSLGQPSQPLRLPSRDRASQSTQAASGQFRGQSLLSAWNQGSQSASPQAIPGQFLHSPSPVPQVTSKKRSGFKGLLTRKVSIPLWILLIAGVVGFGLIFSFGALALAGTIPIPFRNISTLNPFNRTTYTYSTPTSKATRVTNLGPAPTSMPSSKPSPTRLVGTPGIAPTSASGLSTIQTFTGSGVKRTSPFTVPAAWRLAWACNPASFAGGAYILRAIVYNADGTVLDYAAINTTCKSGNTASFTQEHQGGSIYLVIISQAAWTIQIQASK